MKSNKWHSFHPVDIEHLGRFNVLQGSGCRKTIRCDAVFAGAKQSRIGIFVKCQALDNVPQSNDIDESSILILRIRANGREREETRNDVCLDKRETICLVSCLREANGALRHSIVEHIVRYQTAVFEQGRLDTNALDLSLGLLPRAQPARGSNDDLHAKLD